MDIKEYIESGVLEQFCMGNLPAEEEARVKQISLIYPQVREEIVQIELSLERYIRENAIDPHPDLREKIINSLLIRSQSSKFPLIHKHSDHIEWLHRIKEYIPEIVEGDRFSFTLRSSDEITQMLLISSSDFNEETHDDLLESFLILEGECECTVADHVFRLQAGGFASIPLHQPHSVRILSSSVTAVLQRLVI